MLLVPEVASVVGIGVDAVEVARFAQVLARRPSIVLRLFSEEERAYAGRGVSRASTGVSPVLSQRLAVRFAAKEAVLKALGAGLGQAAFAEIEVKRASSGAPSLCLGGRAAELASSLGVQSWHVSLTHTATTAIAFAVAQGGGRAS